MDYQVFISYRRNGGEFLAQLLYERLNRDNYNMFLDVESLHSGKFNEQLYDVIAKCDDFLVVLSPNSLDRCSDPEDWVRLEIECALKNKKNIIPVMMRGFVFPKELPGSLAELRFFNGISADTAFFDNVIKKLESMLHSKANYKSETLNQGEFKALLEHLYDTTVDYRNALREGNQSQHNLVMLEMMSVLQNVFYINEKNKISAPDIAIKAEAIVNQFNKYVPLFNSFINSADRMSAEAQSYAALAEKEFSKFVELIVKYLSE